MLIMEPRNMEETSTENAKISDSGYSNTCSNSQSHTSSGSSVSRNSNRSASSGYHGGNPSTFGSRKRGSSVVHGKPNKIHEALLRKACCVT